MNKTVLINARIDKELSEALNEAIQNNNRNIAKNKVSKSQLIREAFIKFIQGSSKY